MTDETVVEGDLFVGNATYIKGKWVRETDYTSLQRLSERRGDEIRRLQEEVHALRDRLLKAQPPVIAQVIESHEDKGLDYVKRVIASHWTPNGIHVTIAP